MNSVYLIVFLLMGLLVLWQLFSYFKAKSMEGRPAPDTSQIDNGINASKKVIFFHSPGCSPCKSIMPLVDTLQQEYSNLIKLDAAQHVALARQFKLAGTPSFFAINQNQIAQVKLGAVNEEWLRSHLED